MGTGIKKASVRPGISTAARSKPRKAAVVRARAASPQPSEGAFALASELRTIYQTEVFPALLIQRQRGDPIRVWAPECSSGEEAYAIAMLLVDFLGESGAAHPVQVFGSDLDEAAIRAARTGIYRQEAL